MMVSPVYEFDQELHNRTLRDEGFQYGKAVGKEEGIAVGCEQGKAVGREEGIIVGMSRGKAEGITTMILNMYEDNYPLEQIAHIARKSVDEVRTIIEHEVKNTRE